jgi:hypothetical protein
MEGGEYFTYSNDFYLPSRRLERGGVSAPCGLYIVVPEGLFVLRGKGGGGRYAYEGKGWSFCLDYSCLFVCSDEGEQIEWQWPLSGVHSIMMVNSAKPGEGGGCTPIPPFTLSTIKSEVVMYAPA